MMLPQVDSFPGGMEQRAQHKNVEITESKQVVKPEVCLSCNSLQEKALWSDPYKQITPLRARHYQLALNL